MNEIVIIEIWKILFNYLKSHPRLNTKKEVEYPLDSGEIKRADKVYRFYEEPRHRFDEDDVPAIHITPLKEGPLDFTQGREKKEALFEITSVVQNYELNLAIKESIRLANIIQEVLREDSRFRSETNLIAGSKVMDCNYNILWRGSDTFFSACEIKFAVLYFEYLKKF
jgi:hypothetical protein